ncbi:uncharacterized protein LOC143028343 [Oratosquilla oratoria]|uniref:uncharacterized protein LOC143028343 n=1 Tax=Oratosquilla oratoria TaxID=337810 RepID=UPI003F773E2B
MFHIWTTAVAFLVAGFTWASELSNPPVLESSMSTTSQTTRDPIYNTHTTPLYYGDIESTTVINVRYSTPKYKTTQYKTTEYQDPDNFYWRNDVEYQTLPTTSVTASTTTVSNTTVVVPLYQEVEYPYPTIIHTDTKNISHTSTEINRVHFFP